jgi:hypothetical protein
MSILKELRQLNEAASSGKYVWLLYVDMESTGSIDLNDLDTVEVHLSEESAVQSMLETMDRDIDDSDDVAVSKAAVKVKTERQLAAFIEKFDEDLGHYRSIYVITKVQIK